MNRILQQLKGGDRRSIGASSKVVKQVMAQPNLFSVVFDGMTNSDPLVRMRCADAIEKITVRRPEYLVPYKRRLIELAQTAEQQEVRWHLAQLLPRVPLNKPERRRVLDIVSDYLTDASSIVRTFSMQTMADIAAKDDELRAAIVKRLEELTRTGSPAMRSRGEKVLGRLKKVPHIE